MSLHLKPMEFGDIFNYTFRILFRRYFTLYALMAWVYIPLGFIYSYFYYFYIWEFGAANFDYLIRMYLFTFLFSILQYALTPLAQGGVIKVAAGMLYQEHYTFKEAFRAIFNNRIWLTLIILGLIVGLSVFMGLLFLILPGAFLAIVFSMAAPAAVMEGEGIWRSLFRSWSLALKDFGRVFLVMLAMVVLSGVVSAIVTAPIGFAVGMIVLTGADNSLWLLLLGLLESILKSLAAPIPVIAVTLLFNDLRMRHEGSDLEYRLKALEEGETV